MFLRISQCPFSVGFHPVTIYFLNTYIVRAHVMISLCFTNLCFIATDIIIVHFIS